MRSSSNIKVQLDINGVPVAAVIDTAAQVTIVSDKLYNSSSSNPPILKKVILHTAGRDLKMTRYRVGPVSIVIRSQTFIDNEVFVAPVDDDMLLGLDFLQQHQAIISMSGGNLEIGHERIAMNSCSDGDLSTARVAKVTMVKNINVPPYAVLRVPCSLSMSLDDYVIEPIQSDILLSPRLLQSNGCMPLICFVNLSNKNIKLIRGEKVGTAHEIVDVISEVESGEIKLQKVSSKDTSENEVPEHLRDLLIKSGEHLSSQENSLLRDVLSSYADVFAKNEFDLVKFTAIEHGIDTGDARPVKQRLRRTPACYVDEEEKHLNSCLVLETLIPHHQNGHQHLF
ncbi:uncharacterized protein LOC133186229 [Saccostrea echinata]|uniref:uncharacterized protein LOC133186229 n=1 Tax=Saccostrea echinata TaxID=191078 RepID=UPI002A81A31B|nr:uncharacterized protein LOC133186229 [Saccostrea echinata]